MPNVCQQFQSVVEDVPQETGIWGEQGALSYADLWQETGAFAGALRDYDVGAGDVVAIATELERAAVIAVLGALRNGSVVLPLSETYDQSVLKETLSTCSPATIVADPDRNKTMYLADDAVDFNCRIVTGSSQFGIDFERFVGRETEDEADGGGLWEKVSRLGQSSGSERPGLADYWEVIDRQSTDPAVITRLANDTAGYAVYNHEQLQASLDAARTPGGLGADDVLLSTCSPTTVEAVTNVIGATLFGGSTLAIPAGETAKSLQTTIEAADVTVALTGEAMLEQVIDAAAEVPMPPRSLGVLGATPELSQLETIDATLGASAFQVVGVPATCGLSHATHSDDPFKYGSIGQPLPDVQTRILDGGDCPPAADPENPSDASIGNLYVAGDRVTTTGVDGELDVVNREGMEWTNTEIQAYNAESGHCYRHENNLR